jgi:hypothetical protein
LYLGLGFEAFDEFGDFVESQVVRIQKLVKFVVRAHAGEPHLLFQ